MVHMVHMAHMVRMGHMVLVIWTLQSINVCHNVKRELDEEQHIVQLRKMQRDRDGPIQHTEDTKDVPSGKRGRHRPVALEYARPWNMQCRSPKNLAS